MSDNPADAIETMVDRLDDGHYDISKADRELLQDFDRQIRLLGPSEFYAGAH